jgi:hypothetical protein
LEKEREREREIDKGFQRDMKTVKEEISESHTDRCEKNKEL